MRLSLYKKYGERMGNYLEEKGVFHVPGKYDADPEEGKIWLSHSYPIKAFEKFLGYYDREERIAYNPSISFNTDFSYCLAACEYSKNPGQDRVIMDDSESELYSKKADFALKKFRRDYAISGSFHFFIRRYRKYSRAKGMSESSEVAAAVSKALISCSFNGQADGDGGLQSRYARYVSGSGTRAVFQGISMWLSYPGMDRDKCIAGKIGESPDKFYYGIFPKDLQSPTDRAHSAAVQSPLYEGWINDKYKFLNKIVDGDFSPDILFERSSMDMLRLNSVLMSSGIIIQTPESLKILTKAIQFREKNPDFYFTSDTGPSILIASKSKSLLEEFRENIDDPFIDGSFKYDQHINKMKEFKRESEKFFNSL